MTEVSSRILEETIGRAIEMAKSRRHEFVTLEHLLLALAEDPDAVAVMHACNVDIDKLGEDLSNYLDNDLEYLVSDSKADPRPTEAFNRTLQRAVIHVQTSGREDVNGANVMVAVFSERESHAVYFLQEQHDMTRFDAVNYITHGIARIPGFGVDSGTGDSAVVVPRSSELEDSIRRAKSHAVERRHECVTLEHLLLGLTEDQDAAAVLRACKVDLDRIRADLVTYLDKHLDYLVRDSISGLCLSDGFKKVMLRVAKEVHSAAGGEVTGSDVLVAIFSQRESHAVFLLREQFMNLSDAVSGARDRKNSGKSP